MFYQFLPFQNNKIKLITVSYELTGQLKTIQPFYIGQLNRCEESIYKYSHIRFGHNFHNQCKLNIRTLVEWWERNTMFMDLYLNYTESNNNNVNLLKSIPVLIRDAFSHNDVS